MSSVIQPLLDEVASFVARDFAGELGGRELSFAFGELNEERFDAPPRIAFVEDDTCSYRPVDRPGGNGRALWIRVLPLHVVVWAEDDTEVVRMMASVIQAFDVIMHGSFRPIEDTRPSKEDNRDQGKMRVLHLELDTVVTEKEYLLAFATETGFDASAALPGDSNLDANEKP